MSTGSFLHNPWFVRGISLLGFLVVWQVVGESVNPILFAPPLVVAARFEELSSSGVLPSQTLTTVETILATFVIAAVIAVPLGLLMGRNKIVEHSIDPYVNFVYATPTVAVIPLMIIWFGNNLFATYVLVLFHALPVIVVNTSSGVKNINRSLLETGRSFGLKGLSLWRKVVIPATTPYIMAGLRIGIGATVIGTMVAEIFMYNVGLGYVLVSYQGSFDTAAVISGVLVIMALGIALTEGVKFLERKVTWWSRGAYGTA